MKLRALGLLLPLLDKLPWEPRPRRVRLWVGGREVDWWIGPKSDLEVINEILLAGEYDGFELPEPKVVLDLGSHIGVSLLHWRLRWPDARLIGIEPNPHTFIRLTRNASQLPAEVYELAVTDHDGQAEFFTRRQAWESSLADGRGGQSVRVKARRFDTLMQELQLERVDLLKLDIEHGEFEAFRDSARLRDVGAVVGEFFDEGDSAKREAFFSLFEGFALTIRGKLGGHTTFAAVRKPQVVP
jgi:FkbM family methyltransferase